MATTICAILSRETGGAHVNPAFEYAAHVNHHRLIMSIILPCLPIFILLVSFPANHQGFFAPLRAH